MIDEVKVEKLDELVQAIMDGAGSGLPEITESDEGKVLKVSNGDPAWGSGLPEITESDEGKVLKVRNGDPAWGSVASSDPLVYDNTVSTKIGEYHEHDGQTITVHVIKSIVCSPLSTIYLSNGQGAFEANIGNNAEILSCQLVAWDGYNIYSIPCNTLHNTGTLPSNISYTAQWNGTGLPGNGGSAKFYITYVEYTA